MDNFETRLATFVEGCERIAEDNRARSFPNVPIDTFHVIKGKRYVKIARGRGPGDMSVHVFVDKTNGDVLKAAGWKAPAKHARGNIYNEDNGLGCMGPYGAAYLR